MNKLTYVLGLLSLQIGLLASCGPGLDIQATGQVADPVADATVVTLAAPEILDFAFPASFEDDFLFDGESADCMLPCWYGLRPGISTLAEAASTMEEEFELNGGATFRAREIVDTPEDISYAIYSWPLDEPIYHFELVIWFGEDSQIYEGLSIFYAGTDIDMSPSRIIAELGEPSDLYIYINPDTSGPDAELSFLIEYEQGLSFWYDGFFSKRVEDDTSSSSPAEVIDFCLDQNEYLFRSIEVLEPLEDAFHDRSSLQQFRTRRVSNRGEMRPLGEALDVDLKTVADMIAEERNCLTIPADR